MIFKNCMPYRLSTRIDAVELNEQLAEMALQPLSDKPTSCISSTGWVPVIDDVLALESHGAILIQMEEQWRDVPGAVVRDELANRVADIEESQARKVYRKEKLQLKDDIICSLLPKAFIKRRRTRAVIVPGQGWLFVEATASKRAEHVLNLLRETLGSLLVQPVITRQPVSTTMDGWLVDSIHTPGVVVRDYCKMRDDVGDRETAEFRNAEVCSDTVTAHFSEGMVTERIRIEWQEAFDLTLCEDLSARSIKATDQYNEAHEAPEDEQQALEHDVWLTGRELSEFYTAIIDAMGGEEFELMIEEDGK